jgi:hypothetical protein
MEELLHKYKEAKTNADLYQAKMEKYRKRIHEEMKRLQVEAYESKEFVIKKQVQERMSISKKDVPLTVWTQYAKTHPVEFITVRSKSKIKKKA